MARTSMSGTVIEAVALILKGELSYPKISVQVGVHAHTITKWAAQLRAHGVGKKRVASGTPLAPDVRAALMDQLATTTDSVRAIARRLGLKQQTAQRYAQGIERNLPDCPCGKPAAHVGWCTHRAHIWGGPGMGIPNRPALDDEQIEEVRRLLSEGRTVKDVAGLVGASRWVVRRQLRKLTPEQLTERESKAKRRKPEPRNPEVRYERAEVELRDPLYNRLHDLVPRSIDDALRDDIISELYVAVLEGEIDADQAERHVKRFINAAFASFASKWGPLSLDRAMGEDEDGTRFVEMIEDPGALEAFRAMDDWRVG